MWGCGSSSPDMAALFHIWFDLTLVAIGHAGRSKVLTSAVEGTDHISCILSDDSYMCVQFDVSLSPTTCSSKGTLFGF